MRVDGRQPQDLRQCRIEPHYLKNALGSALVTAGDTRVICSASLEARPPAWLADGGWVTAQYAMLPGATHPRARRDPGGRGKEIQRLIARSLRAAVDLSKLVGKDGPLSLVCDCDVLDADGGTRTAAITGAFVALQIALQRLQKDGLLDKDPIVSPVAAVSVGLVELGAEPPRPVLDLNYIEDSTAAVDMNVVGLDGGGLVEVQGTAERGTFDRDELAQMLDLAAKGLEQLHRFQRAAIAG